MELIKPEDCLKLNIPEIDAQHETMVQLINQIHETMLKEGGKAALDGLLSQLMEHTQRHCSYEEQLMSQYEYPGFEAHKTEHAKLLQRLTNLIGRYRRGELLLSFAVVLELKGWACVHIEKSDKPLGEFLNNRNRINKASD